MPTDLTGTPTSQGIGTYNTSVDAPSGLGFNGAMAQIDALFAGRTIGLSAKGDLLIASNPATPARLPIGTTGQVLTVAAGLPSWAAAAGLVTQRKNSATAVNTTATATDLFAGAFTVPILTSTSIVRVTAWGDWLQNSGGTASPPRLQFAFGGTTQLDTSAQSSTGATSGATRWPWRLVATIANAGATNAQTLDFAFSLTGVLATNAFPFTTGEGNYISVIAGGSGYGVAQGSAAGTIDTTSAQALTLKVINGSASATYETKLLGALLEVI